MSHSSQVVVVTGASAGVGRATAVHFARRGYAVALLARGQARLAAAAEEIRAAGGTALPLSVDVADAGAVDDAAARVESELGPIGVWVNNAMASVFAPVGATTPAEFARVSAVTYLGTVHGTLAALARMAPRDRGVIVQVGSALAYRAIPLQSAYCAAKHAIKGFTESLRTELLHDKSGVRVTMVQLPAVNTPQFSWVKSRLPHKAQPVPPIFQPEVVARAIYWAAHHRRRELWVGWPTTKAILAEKLAPGAADRYLARRGYEAQQTAEPEDPRRPDNLWAPAPGAAGAHGAFDARARDVSVQAVLARHKYAVAAAGLAAAGLVLRRRPLFKTLPVASPPA
jgi:short-subunit dehydrogenase